MFPAPPNDEVALGRLKPRAGWLLDLFPTVVGLAPTELYRVTETALWSVVARGVDIRLALPVQTLVGPEP
jgi:hypothetical protein